MSFQGQGSNFVPPETNQHLLFVLTSFQMFYFVYGPFNATKNNQSY